jgi:signal transduction histidine kinase
MVRFGVLGGLRPHPLVVDTIIAVLLAIVGMIGAFGVESILAGMQQDWPLTAFILAASLPLALRRVVPLISEIAILGGSFTLLSLSYDAGALQISVMVALFSVGAHSRSTRESLAGLAAGFVFTVLIGLRPGNQGSLWIFFVFGLMGGLWLVGDTLRRRTSQLAALEARAAALELEREEESGRAVAEERARIARELHDIIAHSVSVMVVQAAAARRVLDSQPDAARASLEAIETTGRQALSEMRRLLGVMRREDVREDAKAPQPSLARVATLVDEMRAAGLPVELRVEGEAGPVPPGVDVSAYRVVQEALTNALRHAAAASVSVVVRYGPDDVEVEVSDDGHGPQEDPDSVGGHGLIGMRERVALFRGDFEAGPRAGGGFAVRARLPIGSSGA